jgi:HEAT repeat protein
MDSLQDSDSEVRFEAVRAAGELELRSARQPIMEMLADPENREDEDIFKAIIWSLSQIGGENVREVLSALLDQAKDIKEEDFITDAMENLELTEGIDVMGMLNFDLEEDDEPVLHDDSLSEGEDLY